MGDEYIEKNLRNEDRELETTRNYMSYIST